jgi:hypothetical protein
VYFDIMDELLIRFLCLSDTGRKMGVEWDNTSVIYRFQEGL